MTLRIRLRCESCGEGQSAAFDHLEETYFDLLASYVVEGWTFALDPNSAVTSALCPVCANKGIVDDALTDTLTGTG